MLKTTNTSGIPNTYNSQSTLIPAHANGYSDLDVVVFGEQLYKQDSKFTAAVMVGLTPAIEGDPAPTPEAAMRKLFTSTCELLKMYIPKVGAHQRNIHGGGVFDEVSCALTSLHYPKSAARGNTT